MRKHILTRLQSLLGARRSKPTHDEARRESPTDTSDGWLFESAPALDATRDKLSADMSDVANSLSDLRETLALIHGETPFPVEATTLKPCAIVHHDEMLFDGEAEAPFIPAQEEVSGGEGVFLFGDAPSFQDDVQEHHQHAA